MKGLAATVILTSIIIFFVALGVLLPFMHWASQWINKKMHIKTTWKRNIVINTLQVLAFFAGFFLYKSIVNEVDFFKIIPIELFALQFPVVVGSILSKVLYKSTLKQAFLYSVSVSAIIVFIYISLTMLLEQFSKGPW